MSIKNINGRKVGKQFIVFSAVLFLLSWCVEAGNNDEAKWNTKSGGFRAEKDTDNVGFDEKDRLQGKNFDDKAQAYSADKTAATGGFRARTTIGNKTFAMQVRAENKKLLKKQLDDVLSLSEREKRSLVSTFDKYQKNRASLSAGEEPESLEMFIRVARDETSDLRMKENAIKGYFAESR